MKTYRIEASYLTYLSLEIEAENLAEAKEIAYNADGGDFKGDNYGDWNIDRVEEVQKWKHYLKQLQAVA